MDKNVNKKGIAGVSLVEIMISLVLVAFALIAITTVFPRIMGHRKNIAEAEQANIIAMEVLDNLQYYSIYGCTIVKNGVTNGNMT
ncbi:type IV pilus modification PilV family protein, partial [Treponema sp. R8-4-B8]